MIERLRVRIPAEAAAEFSSQGLCADSYSVSVSPPVLPQWHVKDPGHSVWSTGGRLHLNTHTPLTQRSLSGLCRCPDLVWEPIRKPAHTQLVMVHSATVISAREALRTDPGIKSGISVRELISTYIKKKKQRRREMNGRTVSPKIVKSPLQMIV